MLEQKKGVSFSSKSFQTFNQNTPNKQQNTEKLSSCQQIINENLPQHIQLRQVQTSKQLAISVDASSQELPDPATIKSNRSAMLPGSQKDKKKNRRKQYSEPRSEKSEKDEDTFSDAMTQTQDEVRTRNFFISLIGGGLCLLGGFYLTGQNKKAAFGLGVTGFLSTYFLLKQQ